MQKVAGTTPNQNQQKNKVAGITPEQLKQKNTVGGITPQQILSKASGDISNYINQYKRDYEKMLDDYYNPKIGAGDVLGGLAYSILKGPTDWLVGAGQFFATTLVQLYSDLDIEDFVIPSGMPRMVGVKSNATPSKETMERRYNALSNVVGNTLLGAYTGIAGATDQLVSSFSDGKIDLGLVGTDGPLSFMGIPEAERFIRAIQTGNFESIYRDFANDFLFPGQLEKDNRANIAETEARYDDVQDQINAVVNAAKYINNDIVEPIVSVFKTENYERFMQENELFRMVMSVTQSIGGILSMWTIGSFAAKSGLSPLEVSSLTNAYFFSSVAGRSMSQALENGVSLQDAYTYGIGMGLTEVALENMIGFTTSGQVKNSIIEDVLSKLVGGKASSIIVSVVGEGLEEVGAELAETGLSYFGENKETYARPSNEEFLSQAVFAFTTGALSSAGLSGARAISNRFTIDSKLSNLQKQYETAVQKDGIDAARKTFESRLNAILKQLNSETARGQKFNKQGTPYTGVLNATDKDTFLFSSGLKRFFTKQNGVYALNQEQINKIDENLFKNKFGRQRIVPITQTDFAFNERVQGIEFNVDMNVDENLLVPKDQLTPEGQMAFDFVLNSQIPFVFYNDATDSTQAFLDGDQNVVFVNEATLIGRTQNQILDILVTHEAIHYIKNLAPELYTKIQKEVLNMVNIKVENGIVTVSSKNKILQEFLNKTDFNGNTYAENLQTSFEDLQQYNLPQDKTNALLVEESVAYFVERMVSGKNIGRSFENNGAELQRIFTSEDINLKSLFGKDKRTIRRFERLQKQIEKAALEAAKKQVTFGYLLDNLLGPDFINILKDDIVAKHTEESIIEGFRFGIDKSKRTIMFDQDVYKIDDIYREGLGPNNFNPKRMSLEKKSPQITFKLNDIQKYISFIEKFVLANENFSELPVKEQRAVKEKIAKYQEVQDVLNRINIMKSVLQKEAAVKTRITSEILDILTEVMTVNVNSRGISKEQEAIFFLTNRLIESLNKKNNVNDFPFVNLHNVPTIQGAKYEKTVIGEGLPEAHKTGLEIWLDAKLSIFNLDKLYDAEVFITRNKEFPTVVAVVKPNALAIKQEVAELEKLRLVQESLLENKDAIEDNKLTLNERIQLDKFFTQKGMAKSLVENAKDVLNIKQDVDLNTLNFIEPSAGAGALIDAMLDIGIEPSRIQAFDISPDKNVFREVPIIKSDFLVSDIPYSDNNVIIGNPPFGTEGDLAINFINKSADIAPVISMILPSIFKDRKHELITDKLKLVKNVLNESQRFDVGPTSRFVKTVTQTWVNKEDARFKTYPDLSVKKVTTKKSTDYISVKYTGKTNRELTLLDKDKTKMILEWYQKQNAKLPEPNDKFTYKEKEYTTRQFFAGAPLKLEYLERVEIISMINLEPDVIVLTEIMSKKGIGVDFNATLNSVDDIKPSNKYMGIRFNQPSGMDVLRAMDLNNLSRTSRLSRIGFSGDEFQKLFEETKIKMKRIDSRKVAPLDIAGNRLSVEQQVYFQDSKARVDGKLMVLYHGSPNANIESFDTAFSGTNTGVFERLTYFTNDLLTAENFSYPSKETNSMFIRQRTGEKGKIYSLYVNIENPLDFRNLRTKDIDFLVQSFQEELASDKEDAERSVRRGIDNNNHQFLKIGISDVTLRKAGYDGIIAEMYRDSGIFEFGVLNPEQIKSIDNKQPINDNKINNIRMKRINDEKINFKEQEKIEKIFGLYTNQLLQLNKSGEYVVKNEYVKTTVQKPAAYVLEFIDKNSNISTTLNLKNNEYAVSLPYTFGDNVKISNSNNSIFFNKNKSNNVVLLKELSKDKPMKLIYDLLKSTDLPFMFIDNGSKDALGLYIHEIKNNRSLPQNMIFINIADKKQTFQDVFSSLLHEHIHAMTAQYSIFYTQDIRQSIADLFFTYDSDKNYIGVTKTYQLFIDMYYGGDLLSYISEYDAAKDIIKKDEDIYSILVGKPVPSAIGLPIKMTSENVLKVSEELTAQFVPMLLLRDEFFFELSKINPNTFIQMGGQFENMLKFTKSKKLQFDLLNKIQTEFKIKFKNYIENNMNVLFTKNLKNNYTLKDINTFIKEFTSDKYITKNQLMASLLAEQKSGKKGEAAQTIENILYVASLLGPTIQKSISEYTEMEKMYVQVSKEMDSMTKALNVILFQPKEISRLFDKNMEKAYKSIATFRRFISSSQKGKKIALTFNEDGTFKDTFLESFNDNIIVLQESLTEFAQLYNEIMPSLLEAFGLENNAVVQSKVFTLLQNIESILSKDLNLNDLENLITNFLSEVTIALKKDDVLVKVAEFQKQSQEQFSKNIINALKDANKKANDSILSVSRQSQSPYNDNLNNVNVIINKITQAFEKNVFTINESKDEVLSLVSELQEYVRMSDLTYDIIDELDTGAFSSVYLQLAMLYEDSSIIRNATNMFTSQKEYFDIVKLKTLIKKFSEVRLANNINRVLTVFATKYTTSFNDTQTLDDYANDNIKSILSIENQWKTEGLSKTSSIQTPQDFFKFFADMGLQKGNVRFFDDFFREYVKADFNRSNIIQDYMENIKAFNEKHPDAFKQSLEKVNIETQYLSPIPNDVMNTIVKKIDAQFNFYNETIRQNTNTIKNIKKEIVILRNEIKELKTRKSGLDKKEQAWKTINEVQKSIQEEISAASLKIQSLRLENARTKDLRDVGTKEQFIIIEMREYSIENNLTATITYGQLINMLKGIKREIETAARYELEPINNINPTDHFKILNTIDFFDNEVSVNKGYQTAKNETDRYTILLPKEKILSYLETLVRPQDIATIDFATEMFEKIYDHVDKYFFAMYQVHMPFHPSYIGFQTLNSDLSRNFDSKVTNRRNQKPFDGMTIETTIGASTPLMIENIFGIVSNTFQRAGNYVYRRLIADYQNLMVNVQENTTFQNELSSKTSKIGRGNNFEKMVETSFSNILGYGDVDMPKIEKVLNKVLMRSVGATMALGIPSFINQTASIATIALKNNLNIAELTKNITLSLVPGNKFHKWLMVNNSNYYMRAIVGGIPSLAQDINTNLYLTMNEGFQKVTNFLSRHISYMDAAVLVGAFKTIFDDVRKKDSTLSEDQAFTIANEKLTEILIFGVANTSPAFRSNFSGSKNFILRMISRFQSESVLQISALIVDRYRMLNGLSGATKKFIRDTIAYTISGIFTGIVGVVFDLLRGRVEEEEVGAIYLLNELLWQSTIGMIPYLNLITRMIQFTDEGVVAGFEPQIPLLSDIYKISETLISMQNGQNLGRKSLRILENMTGILGLPLRNSVRIISSWSNFLGDQGIKSAQDMTQFFYSKSNGQMLIEGVRSGNKAQINNYVEKVYNNYAVRNEIVNLLFSVEGSKINLYDVDFFRKTVDGVSTKYTIPDKTKDSYQKLAQTSLFKTINSEAYKKLTKEEKIKAIQRVINYYQNALKSDVLDESFELLTVEEVSARALR